MLPASAASPNMQLGENSRPAPKPENWNGVAEGLNRARQHVGNGLYQKAIDTLKEILEFAPSEPQAWRLLGDILGQHGHTQKAEACRQKAERFEKHASHDAASPASARLARLLWTQGEAEAARAMLAVLLMRKPEDEQLLALRAEWSGE